MIEEVLLEMLFENGVINEFEFKARLRQKEIEYKNKIFEFIDTIDNIDKKDLIEMLKRESNNE